MSLAHFLKISPKLIRPKTQGEEVLEETWNTIPHGGEAGLQLAANVHMRRAGTGSREDTSNRWQTRPAGHWRVD